MKYNLLIILAFITGLISCSKQDYVNAIPANSTALISVKGAGFAGEQSPFASLLEPFTDSGTKQMKGIDLSKEIYLFASGDGNLGVCAPVNDSNELDDVISGLESLGVLKNHKELEGKDFHTLNDQWMLGRDDCTLLIMGPVTGVEAERKLMRRMVRQMDKDDNGGIRSSMIWQHMQELSGNTRLVAQASALPEQIALAITLGAPKGTDPDDVLLEAELTYNDSTLQLLGTTCSYNQNVKQALKKSQAIYNPITVDWEKMMGDTAVVGIFMNVNGKELMPYIQTNKALNTMLMGTDSYDKIRNNDGNIAILLMQKHGKETEEMFSAKILELTDEKTQDKGKFIVAINMEVLAGPLKQAIAPFLGNVKRITYNMNTKQ